MRPISFLIFCTTLLVALSACTIHTIDIQQGNVLEEETVNKLVVGMNKRQARFIMGTPLIHDPFHQDRWDYIYTLRPGNKRTVEIEKHLTLFFKDDELIKIQHSDNLAAPDKPT